jgi:phosphoribosylanthranilate isomerase
MGGTGQTFDWNLAAEISGNCRIILAGGLTPENVAEAIHKVCPYGVDVSSGVEKAPGRKDPDKLAAFICNARNA